MVSTMADPNQIKNYPLFFFTMMILVVGQYDIDQQFLKFSIQEFKNRKPMNKIEVAIGSSRSPRNP